jgi:RNA polymerase sigma-70 factor (ECF subfamily)
MRRQVRTAEDASDLVQQTFLQLHRARKDFREGALLRPWLYTIALNLRREYFRLRARRPQTTVETTDRADDNRASPEEELQSAQTARGVREALTTLPPGQQAVIELHWFEGLSFGDISAMLGVGLSAVKVRAHRGYGQLRGELSQPAVDRTEAKA